MTLSVPSVYATIIVPTHDRDSTLELAVRSIQAQTVRNLEIMIVGDGVTADVREVAARLASSDPRIVFHDWLKAAGRGGENRDRAVRMAKAERIFYIDDDDLFLPQHIARLGPVLDEYDVVDSAMVSVSLSGRLQMLIGNHRQGPMRKAAADGTVRALVDTHFAHRKSTYQRLDQPWISADRDITRSFFSAFARDPLVGWKTIPDATALSFHGSARRYLSHHERRTELEDWWEQISRGLLSDLSSIAYYDWHIFRIAEDLQAHLPDLPIDFDRFLRSCRIRLNELIEDGGADITASIPHSRITGVRNAFALLRSEPVANYEAAELAIRLTDPLLGVQPHHRKVVALLKASVGAETAIDALNRVEAGDAHSQEIREHLVCFLLLEQCSITEVQARIAQLLNSARYYRGEALTFAAEVSRRRGVPESALDYAQAAIKFDPKIFHAHKIAVWALLKLDRTDAAWDALSLAQKIFPTPSFAAALRVMPYITSRRVGSAVRKMVLFGVKVKLRNMDKGSVRFPDW